MCSFDIHDVQDLIESLAGYEVVISEQQGEKLLGHLELVLKKNKELNLTRIVDWHEAVIKHVVDSLLILRCIPVERSNANLSFVDIGTGAGFPGVPLGIVTEWQGSLIDSVQKKAAAVSGFVHELGIDNLSAHGVRVEDFAHDHDGEFDLVVARAVADVSVLMEYAAPLLRYERYLCISKGLLSKDESERADIVSQLTGFVSVSRETLELPEDMGERTMLLYQKIGNSSVKLPRRAGMALKRPLYLHK